MARTRMLNCVGVLSSSSKRAVMLRGGTGVNATRLVNTPGARESAGGSRDGPPSYLKNAMGRGWPFSRMVKSWTRRSVTGCPFLSSAVTVSSTTRVVVRNVGARSCGANARNAATITTARMRSLYHSGTPQKGQRFVVESGHAGCGPLSNAVSRWTRGHAHRQPRSRDADVLTETPHPRLSSRHTIRDSCKKPRRDRSKARGASRMADPRLYQIRTLTSPLVYGMGWPGFAGTRDRAAPWFAAGPPTPSVTDRP